MINNIKLNNILFLDIETVSEYETWSDVPNNMQALFDAKTKYKRKDNYTAEEFYHKAGIWAEFGKIICISVAFFVDRKGKKELRVTSFYNTSEKELLVSFKKLLSSHFNKPDHLLCAHNGKEFDFPYIARRMIIHQIEIPNQLNLFGKKPWEIQHLDTLDLWKFGDYKHYTSLKLLTEILKVPSPKVDIDGSEVGHVYYTEKNLLRIVEYCERDTVAVAQLLLRFNNLPLIESDFIIKVN